ncbi:MAG: NAD-dependent epimerase/dehydratase family protein [Verrucomicrobiaceae bacterium]|nr:MAG: NAD-dependent epimerase/dehydratase family protein [Verrucomicrobiaceae bacterium]
MKHVLITGGAGFIGSNLAIRLVRERGCKVTIYDNLRTGNVANLQEVRDNPLLDFQEGDILDPPKLTEAMKGVDTVFHLAANADVRGGQSNRRIDLDQNTVGTWNVLEACRVNQVARYFFASSATVYGEPDVFPTPETMPLIQTSVYGASKLAGEAMAQAYSEYDDMQVVIFRFVSWTGPSYSHGVVRDFCGKLKQNPECLHILGDGTQRKSFLDVRDGINGLLHAADHGTGRVQIYNVGHDEWVNVNEVAETVVDALGLTGARFNYGGGERGWKGDSPLVLLDTTRLKSLGWSANIGILQSIRDTVQSLKKAGLA